MVVVVAAVLLLILLLALVLVEAVALVAVLVILPTTTPATGTHTRYNFKILKYIPRLHEDMQGLYPGYLPSGKGISVSICDVKKTGMFQFPG
jgi:hypothetical protein